MIKTYAIIIGKKEVDKVAGNTEYKNKWQTENYDRINLTVKKGKKAILQAYAEKTDGSLNKFINRAIDETIERDKEEAENS